jgi:type I restriction enzyme S subunit
MKIKFDVTPKEFLIIKDILRKYLVKDCKAYIFGSRATTSSLHGSDLDIALECKEKINFKILSKIKIDLENSRLPYMVDIIDLKAVKGYFRKMIENEMIEFPLGKLEKVPELRFKEFSGEWEEKKLGDIGNIIGGGTPDTSNKIYWNGNIQWFTPTEIKTKYISNSNRTITDLGLKKSSAKLLPKGTLLLTSRATIGDIAIATNECTTNQGFQSLIVNNDNETIYLYNWIILNKKEFIRKSSGSTFLEISKKEIEKIKLNLPQKQEQEKIASFLTSVDTKIEQLTSKKELIEKYKKGIMQKIFNQEIRFKDDDGSEFEEWEEEKLGNITTLMQSGLSRLLNENDIGLPVIRSNNLQNGSLNVDDIKYWYKIDNQGANTKNYILQNGDILINFINSIAQIGKVSIYKNILKRDTIFTTNIMRVKFKDHISSKYIYYFFNTNKYKNYISTITKPAVNQASFTTKEFNKLDIPLPRLNEQIKIANFLSSIDKKIEFVSNQLNQTKEFKKGLLQKMFV